MERLWFISNIASGSADDAKCEAIEEIFREAGLELAGRTRFPDDPLPSAAQLDGCHADTVVLFAGDGTINAATGELAEWEGAILILPGGTMNMLAKALHGAAEPAEIIRRAHQHGRRIAIAFVQSGERRALVGAIIGPVANWVHAREMVRDRRLKGLVRALGFAWRRTFEGGVRISGVPGLTHRAQAVFVRPGDGGLQVALIDARDWRSIAELGWDWLTGDWFAARGVDSRVAERFAIAGRRPVLALFDGEPVTLEPGAAVTGGETLAQFLTTKEAA